MAECIPPDEQTNYETFRDCFSEPVLRALVAPIDKSKKKTKRATRKSRGGKIELAKGKIEAKAKEDVNADEEQATAEDLGDFVDYLSGVIFPSLPSDLRTLTYPKFKDSPQLQDRYSTPLSASTTITLLNTMPPMAVDSLESYGLLPFQSDANDLHHFFTPLLTTYIVSATAPPPIWSTTRTSECELCGRSWIPLSYHHLIPKSTHERVLKRRWHSEDQLNSVAWLCRACHSFVHRLASNEELAKSYYTVELIQEGGVEGDAEKKAVVEVGEVGWRCEVEKSVEGWQDGGRRV
ncbi:hypothetical protein N0V90_010249 [Kalmusia sp. IMI 367209]|nr:hypothetical protein N0V90_010249 [Kalmusia sp. IMI 367209]